MTTVLLSRFYLFFFCGATQDPNSRFSRLLDAERRQSEPASQEGEEEKEGLLANGVDHSAVSSDGSRSKLEEGREGVVAASAPPQ